MEPAEEHGTCCFVTRVLGWPSSKVDIDPAIDEPIARALAPDPSSRFETPLALFDALHAVIHPSASPELDVIALYAEASSEVIAVGKSRSSLRDPVSGEATAASCAAA